MANIQVRVPDDDVAALDALADDLQVSRSDAARQSLHAGLRALRLEGAWRRYAAREWSLERAAAEAKASLQQMAEFAEARGTPYFRYGPEELARDAETARRALASRRRGAR